MTEQQPLKLEVGRAYRTRDGQKVSIIGESGIRDYPLQADNGQTYNAFGQSHFALRPWEHDLIAEWDAPDADGWVQWAGGECPVPPETVVNWRTDGKEPGEETWAYKACDLDWSVVTAYRVVTPAPAAEAPKHRTVTTGNLKATPLEGVGKNPSPEPDYKDIAHEMAAQLGMAIIRLRANPDWLGVLVNRETGERYSWEESFARSIERLPELKVDRRYLEAKQLPAKQRRARYAELEAEKRAKESPCPTS